MFNRATLGLKWGDAVEGGGRSKLRSAVNSISNSCSVHVPGKRGTESITLCVWRAPQWDSDRR